jgi:hypothetical protein
MAAGRATAPHVAARQRRHLRCTNLLLLLDDDARVNVIIAWIHHIAADCRCSQL